MSVKNKEPNFYDPELREEHDKAVERYVRLLKSEIQIGVTKYASREQDLFEKWDVFMRANGISFRTEVKSIKGLSRHSGKQDEWIWQEFINGEGYPGWLYGKSDFIAFEIKTGFIVVNREELVKLVEELVGEEIVTTPYEAKYKLYSRKNRKDLATLIHRKDLETINHIYLHG